MLFPDLAFKNLPSRVKRLSAFNRFPITGGVGEGEGKKLGELIRGPFVAGLKIRAVFMAVYGWNIRAWIMGHVLWRV